MGDAEKPAEPDTPDEAALTRVRLEAEIANLKANARKAEAEAANADAHHQELIRRRTFFERILSTTQFTVFLGLLTLTAQIAQTYYTGHETRLADETRQWQETVSNVSFDGDSKAVKGALDLEAFLGSKRYGGEARTMLAAVVPPVQDNDAFDHLFSQLVKNDDWSDGTPQTYAVARAIAFAYGNSAAVAYPLVSRVVADGVYRTDVSDKLLQTLSPKDAPVIKAAHEEWQIDSVTNGLLRFWKKWKTRPAHVPDNYKQNLDAVILRLGEDEPIDLQKSDFSHASMQSAFLHRVDFSGANLQGTDFSGSDLGQVRLTGATLDGATLKDANLDQVVAFDRSSWRNVKWWQARTLSKALCARLGKGDETWGPPAPAGTRLPPCAEPEPGQ